MAKRYGCGYMRSKNRIAEDIINFLPSGNRLVDLFGGGGAITHCACEHILDKQQKLFGKKWKSVLYNDFNPLTVQYFKDCISGRKSDKWISREDFEQLKDKDGFIKYLWSFGNNGQTYMYSSEIEPWKEALHYVKVFNDFSKFEAMGISKKDLIDIKTAKNKYITHITGITDVEKFKEDTKDIKKELQNYLLEALKKEGKTQAEINRTLNCQMSTHWFSNHQWAFPTKEYYEKLQKIIPLPKKYEEVYGVVKLKEQLQRLQRLQSLESLQSLERLQSLEGLERLQSLEISNISYDEYVYKQGDVVYCDIPYENTHEYDGGFNHKKFYDWAYSQPYPIYISSYNIKDNRFICVWQKEKYALFSRSNKTKIVIEKIYTQRR